MARHLLVTNDYPPKTGGIQVYLHELWRRLEPQRAVVVTATSAPHAEVFDATSEIAIERIPRRRFSFPRGARNGPSKRRSPVTSPIWSCWIRRGRSVCWAPSSPFPTASSCTVRR